MGEDIFIGCDIEDATFDCETVLPFFKGKDSLKKITFTNNNPEGNPSGLSILIKINIIKNLLKLNQYFKI